MEMKNIEHVYEYNRLYVDESLYALHDKNLPVYEKINELAAQAGCKLHITHFISKHSRNPQSLYEDFEVKVCPQTIRYKLDEILAGRFLVPLKVSDNKGFLDRGAIESGLYALSR